MNTPTTINRHGSPRTSVLASLRRLVPQRALGPAESLRLAELQATHFRRLVGQQDAALDESVLATLPRIRIERRDLPTSGLSYWNGDCWVIALNEREPAVRQRFTLMHEYKHILDHGATERLYRDTANRTARQQAEHAADYFAGCVLMPKLLLKRAWYSGIQARPELAELFDVSARAVEVRLSQIGLTEPIERCQQRPASHQRAPGRFYRALHPAFTPEGVAA